MNSRSSTSLDDITTLVHACKQPKKKAVHAWGLLVKVRTDKLRGRAAVLICAHQCWIVVFFGPQRARARVRRPCRICACQAAGGPVTVTMRRRSRGSADGCACDWRLALGALAATATPSPAAGAWLQSSLLITYFNDRPQDCYGCVQPVVCFWLLLITRIGASACVRDCVLRGTYAPGNNFSATCFIHSSSPAGASLARLLAPPPSRSLRIQAQQLHVECEKRAHAARAGRRVLGRRCDVAG